MAEPTGEHVTRGGKEGGLTGKYHYNAANSGPVSGWSKVDNGAVGDSLEGGDNFSAAQHKGNAGHPQPGAQT